MLKARGLSKRFGDVAALSGLDLTVEPGEILCLLGANGAGKTTTVNLFLGFLTPDEGSVEVFGLSPPNDRARRDASSPTSPRTSRSIRT